MICLNCDNNKFVPKPDAVIEQEFRNETFHVHTPALACAKCGWTTVDLQQADELRHRTADAYRTAHGLLTSDEIKTYRKMLSMNQVEFAELVNVGVASIKRWETWQVQEKSSDGLIRLKVEQELKRRADELEQKRLAEKGALDMYIDPQPIEERIALPEISVVTNICWGGNRTQTRAHQQGSKRFADFSYYPQLVDTGPPDEFAEDSAFSFSAPSNRTLKKQMLIHLN